MVAGSEDKRFTVFVGEVLRKKRRKILSVTWKNYSMPTGFTLLHFNLGQYKNTKYIYKNTKYIEK